MVKYTRKFILVMYGLLQVGILVNDLLAQRLGNHGYYQVKNTQFLWCHVWHPISFTLVVNNFGTGYDGCYHADHIMGALKIYYEIITTDWEVSLYCGVTTKFNYEKWYVNNLMPGYVNNTLHHCNHEKSTKPQHQPYPSTERTYGADS